MTELMPGLLENYSLPDISLNDKKHVISRHLTFKYEIWAAELNRVHYTLS
jgi:hypothetical protein